MSDKELKDSLRIDERRSYGQVLGTPGIAYVQDNKYYDSHKCLIPWSELPEEITHNKPEPEFYRAPYPRIEKESSIVGPDRNSSIDEISERLHKTYGNRATREDAAIADLIFMCDEVRQAITKYQKVLRKALEDPDTTIEEIKPIAKRLSACYKALFQEHKRTIYPNELITEAIKYAIEHFEEIQQRAKEGGHKTLESLCRADPEAERLVERDSGNPGFPVDKILKRKASELAISYVAITGFKEDDTLDEGHIRRKIEKIFLLA